MLCDLVVRPFQSTDAAPVSALIATTMHQSNARDYPRDRLEALIAYFTPDKLRALAGERGLLGGGGGRRGDRYAARERSEFATFFVHPAWQRHGLGTQLLEQLERNAQALGIQSLPVEVSTTGTPFY